MHTAQTVLTHPSSGTVVVDTPLPVVVPFSFWADAEWASGLSVGDTMSLYRDDGSLPLRVAAIGEPECLHEDPDTGEQSLEVVQISVEPDNGEWHCPGAA